MNVLAETASGLGDPRLWIEYVAYAAVIVVGLIVLAMLRKAGRLPKNAEFKKQLVAFSEAIVALSKDAPALSRYRFSRRATRLTARADKLAYTAAQMADKERDGDLETASGHLESARTQLAAYKFGKRDASDLGGMSEAAASAARALALVDGILGREAELKARTAKKN